MTSAESDQCFQQLSIVNTDWQQCSKDGSLSQPYPKISVSETGTFVMQSRCITKLQLLPISFRKPALQRQLTSHRFASYSALCYPLPLHTDMTVICPFSLFKQFDLMLKGEQHTALNRDGLTDLTSNLWEQRLYHFLFLQRQTHCLCLMD